MAKTAKLTAQDIKRVVAFPPTPVRDGANTPDNRDAINYEEAYRINEWLAGDDFVGAIALNGTFGEFAAITWEELKKYTATVIEAVKGRKPVFAGATTHNTRDTIDRAKAFRDMGADGILIGRPVIPMLSGPGIVRYYQDVAEAVPELNIMIYDDMEQFKGPIPSSAYAELAKIPQIICGKYRDRSVIGSITRDTLLPDLKAVGDKIKLLQIESDWYYHSRMFEGEERMNAFWSVVICCAPSLIKAQVKAVEEKDWVTAKEAADDMAYGYELLLPPGQFSDWPLVKIPLLKTMITESGLVNAGPALPPYYNEVVPPEYKISETAKEIGRRWREAEAKWSARCS